MGLLDNGGPRYTIEQIDAERSHRGRAGRMRVPDQRDRAQESSTVTRIWPRSRPARAPNRRAVRPSDWDFMLGCRAAEYGYGDDMLGALIRHVRRLHGEEKGERDDYIERTIAAVRRRVGYVGADATQDEVLAELTKTLRLGEIERRVVATHVAGTATRRGGDRARRRLQHRVPELRARRATGQARRPARDDSRDHDRIQQAAGAPRRVRSCAERRSRTEELREHEVYIDEAVRLLRLAKRSSSTSLDQASSGRRGRELDAIDPEDDPRSRAARLALSAATARAGAAEAYARRMVDPSRRETGVRFVHAGWFQHSCGYGSARARRRSARAQAILRAGWTGPRARGRIKATSPARRPRSDPHVLSRPGGLGGATGAR